MNLFAVFLAAERELVEFALAIGLEVDASEDYDSFVSTLRTVEGEHRV